MRTAIAVSFLSAIAWLSVSTRAAAQDGSMNAYIPAPPQPFEPRFSLGLYALGWEAEYSGAGVGGRAGWQPLSWLGVEVFSEHLLVEHRDSSRHDHPIGFNLTFPIPIGDTLRLKPLFGFCAVFSFIDPVQPSGERADDVLFGAHAGLAAEMSLSERWSFFVELQGIAYVGHGRYVHGWSSAIDGTMRVWGTVQGAAGVQFNFHAL